MKKVISLILSLVMLFSVTAFAHASEADVNSLLAEMNIMNGYPDGGFYPEEPVTRAQFAKIAVNSSKYKNMVAHGMPTSPFADVTYTHWAAPYIKAASANKLIQGYPDSTFLPENTVTLAEAVTVAVKLLGYTDSDFSTSWPYGQMGLADNIGLLDGIDKTMNDPLTRGEVRTLIYNTLRAYAKGSNSEYITTLGYSVIENVTLIASNNENSSVAAGKIHTSAGTYKIDDGFDMSNVGARGDAIVKDGELKLFFGSGQVKRSYAVYSATDSDVVVYSGGSLLGLGLDKNVKAYYNLQEQSLGNILQTLDMGYGIDVFYNTSGGIDYVCISTGRISGPVTAHTTSTVDYLGFDEGSTYMRDGKKVNKSSISQYDILYYSTAMDTVWAYSKKVTGVFEKALPNKDNITSVTVSGTTYQLESAAAMAALSSGGKFELGDTVTLLLGRDGRAADVMDPSGVNEVVYGILKAVGTKQFTDTNGNGTTSYYADVVLTNGNTVTYPAKSKYDNLVNKPVRLSVKGGEATVSKISSSGDVYGKVDASKMTIGKTALASDIEILDVTTTDAYDTLAFTTVFPARLDGVTVSSSAVLYYSKNGSGEIDKLILKDVTGDAYSYGIVRKAATTERGGTYEVVIGAENKTINSPTTKFLVQSGQPAKFEMAGNTVSKISGLSVVPDSVTAVTSTYIETDEGKYALSDKVVCYDENYMVVPISDVIGGGYSVTAYYDRHPNMGGRIRVLKVKAK
ncbi:MAG: S-layer homology domain-containing protein [Clostridia bacterium]|nr:S-layer homology domain-containing protein [Clostridia bacterium]